MERLDAVFVRRVLDSAPEGVAICDATGKDCPVIYVNAAFEQMTGYAGGEVEGLNLRLLQGTDRDQEGIRRMREAIARGESCRALLRNYRKNGELLWNEVVLQPLRGDGGALTHWVAYFRDATGRLKQADKAHEGVPTWLREDRVTGLSSRPWFNELLAREWQIARREKTPLTLVLFDLDALESYNATFGRSAGDACLRRIGKSIGGVFRRGSDVVGIWSEGCIGVLAVHRDGTSVAGVVEHAMATVRRVAEMRIHHPRSPQQKFVTVTAGLATVTPQMEEQAPERLVERAQVALKEAKRDMRGALNQAPD
jgi:diguanylate cyclase (GGDEF)-like protein/PAS domain S-box-containing protein